MRPEPDHATWQLPPAVAEDLRLTVATWHELREPASRIRHAVFVDEQGIPVSLEWDDRDEASLHCVAWAAERAIGTGRLLADGHIGRMAVNAGQRRRGIGSRILETLVAAARERGDKVVHLSAQRYAQGFYERHGFSVSGAPYQEAGIEHVAMRRELSAAATD
jgi:predicted GNAT family N-acyltransferase